MISLLSPALLLAASATTDLSIDASTSTEHLSSAEISALLSADGEIPGNCQILGNPCFVIRCDAPTQPGHWPGGLYDCSVLN